MRRLKGKPLLQLRPETWMRIRVQLTSSISRIGVQFTEETNAKNIRSEYHVKQLPNNLLT